MRWSHLHGDMQGQHACVTRTCCPFAVEDIASKVKSEIPCRVSTNLPRRLVRGDRDPAHIGETLVSTLTKGNPEGSPSDPLTTDPKGEACHASESPKIYVMRNTPALIVVLASMSFSARWCTMDRDKAVYRSGSV
jgi:hypothetical protein